MEEARSTIKHGGPGKTFILTRTFTSKFMLQQVKPSRTKPTRAHKVLNYRCLKLQQAKHQTKSARRDLYHSNILEGPELKLLQAKHLSDLAKKGRWPNRPFMRKSRESQKKVMNFLFFSAPLRTNGANSSCKWKSRKVL